MKTNKVWEFARKEMTAEGETLRRAEQAGPFVVALVELAEGGYDNRAAQPAVVYARKRSKLGLPAINIVETYGPSHYTAAARRFNKLVDEELI